MEATGATSLSRLLVLLAAAAAAIFLLVGCAAAQQASGVVAMYNCAGVLGPRRGERLLRDVGRRNAARLAAALRLDGVLRRTRIW